MQLETLVLIHIVFEMSDLRDLKPKISFYCHENLLNSNPQDASDQLFTTCKLVRHCLYSAQ
jgi:hypothetical protein